MRDRTTAGMRGHEINAKLRVGDPYPPMEGKYIFETDEAFPLTGRSVLIIPYLSARGMIREYRFHAQSAKTLRHLKLLAFQSLTRRAPYDPATQQAAKIAIRFCEIYTLIGYGQYENCLKRGTVLSHNTIKPILLRKTHKNTIKQK